MKFVNIRDFIMVLFGMVLSLTIVIYSSLETRNIFLILLIWLLVLLIAIFKNEIEPKEL